MPGFSFVEKKGSAPQPAPAVSKSEQLRPSIVKELLSQKENPKGDAYLKDCVICRNDAKVTISQSTPKTNFAEQNKNETKNNKVAESQPKETKQVENQKETVKTQGESKSALAEKIITKTSPANVSTFYLTPPKKEIAQNNVSLEKTEIVSFSKNVNTKNTEVKTQAQPVTVTRYPTNTQETKAPVNSQVVIQNTASTQAKPEVINQNIQITTPVATPNPVVQINLIPQVMPALNTVLLTQLIPQKGIGNFSGIKNFTDFLPIKNNKQNLVESEKFQFSTPLISTKVLAQILNNKDTTSLNALRALLHLFGREIEDEKDDTDLEGAYGLWKEYLKKIKRKKSKQALSQNRQQKTQSLDMEELGIRS
jgi:hypothetical protein